MVKLNENEVQEWVLRIESWQDSNLSMIAWCNTNQVSYDKLKYWREKLNLPVDRNIRNTVLAAYPNASKIFLHEELTNMGKSFDSLRRKIEESSIQMANGTYFVFLGRRHRSLKILSIHSGSEVIWYKRLSYGTFLFKSLLRSLAKQDKFLILL